MDDLYELIYKWNIIFDYSKVMMFLGGMIYILYWMFYEIRNKNIYG